MTYAAQETGIATGAPAELYKFSGFNQTWYYTSADEEINYLGNTYLPGVMKRSENAIEGQDGESNIDLTTARDNEVAMLYRVIVPARTITLTIYRLHRSEVTPEVIVYWQGRIRSVTWKNSEAIINCSLQGTFKRQGPNMLYQKVCPHILYSPRCGVSKEGFKVTGQITAINGSVITTDVAGSQADGYWLAGYAETGGEVRAIIAHSGAVVTLMVPLAEASVGDTLTLYAGCNHSKTDCATKFNNVLNFGGMPYMPIKNPFDVGVEG